MTKFKTYRYNKCETCDITFCKNAGTGKDHINWVWVGVFLENQFNAVYSYNHSDYLYKDSIRWFYVDNTETELLDKLQVNHIYNITVDEYSSFIDDDGSISERNHQVTHKCKVLKITSDSNKAINPCNRTNSRIYEVEEIIDSRFDYDKKVKIKDRNIIFSK